MYGLCVGVCGKHSGNEIVSFLQSWYDLKLIPIAEMGQNVHVQVALAFKKIIELV